MAWRWSWCVLVVLAVAAALMSGCSSVEARRGRTVALDPDLDDDLGGTGIESGDVRGAADRIARALAHDLKRSSARARVAVIPVLNRTRFRVDPALVQNHLVHDLQAHSRGRFAIVAVRDAQPRNATAVLRTELRSLTKDNGEATSDYVEYFFALEDPVDGTVLWSGLYETKRLSSIDVIYQ
jgi:PBP1b-binding outer membrane lipoprotein LpoB